MTVLDRHHRKIASRDLGFGTISNVGVTALALDSLGWPVATGVPFSVLNQEKFCATGTGTTAGASTDMGLQTADSVTPVSGTITSPTAANAATVVVTCTLAYTGTEAVTEFGLFNLGTLSATTGTPWTAGSGTSGTVTGTPYTASTSSVHGETMLVFEDTTKSPAIYGICTSNTTSVVTVPAWYNVTNGVAAGTSPANTDALKIVPVMLDHLVFSAINVVNGDSIAFTFTLTLPSGSFIFLFLFGRNGRRLYAIVPCYDGN
jgi:hypothetical protein